MQNFLVDCNTSTVGYPERYQAWSNGLAQTFGPLRFEPDPGARFFGSIRVKARDKLRFNRLSYGGQRVQRQAQDVRQLTAGFYTFTCPTSGCLQVVHDHETRLLVPDQVYLFNHATTYSTIPLDNYQTVSVSIPEHVLHQRIPRLRSFYSLPAGPAGIHGKLLKSLGGHLGQGLERWNEHEFSELSEKFFDLLALLFGQEADASTSNESTVRLAHLEAARRHIRANAGDPELTPATVAQACRISLGYLHQVFRDSENTVEETIFIERLEQAKRLLGDAKLNGTSISTIAYMSGFNHPAHFSRSFRRRFGKSPRDFRAG